MVHRINRPGGIFPGILSAMDLVLKDMYDNYRKEGTMPEEILSKSYKLFDDPFYLDQWRSFSDGGIRYNNKEENFIFMGMIDDLSIDSNSELLIPFDFKTAKAAPTEIHKSFRVQLACYAYLLQKNGFQVSDYGLLSYHWPISAKYSNNIEFGNELVKVENIRIDSVEKTISNALKVARSAIAPSAGADCQFCEYKDKGKLE